MMALGRIFIALQRRLTVHGAGRCITLKFCVQRIDDRMSLDKYERLDDMGDKLGDL